MHQYYWEGEGAAAADRFLNRIKAVTAWAKNPDPKNPARKMKLFLSEFGAGEDVAKGEDVIKSILEHLNANNDVWIGWTPWNLEPYTLTKPGSQFTEPGKEMDWYDDFLEPNTVSKP
jgi:hypothetical protein